MTAAPDWRDLVIDEASTPNGSDRRSVGINFPADLMGAVRAAAEARNMSMAAFVRRAALAVAAHDLGLDWATLMEKEPGVRDYSHRMTEERDAPRRGRGHGPWVIKGMGVPDVRSDESG